MGPPSPPKKYKALKTDEITQHCMHFGQLRLIIPFKILLMYCNDTVNVN